MADDGMFAPLAPGDRPGAAAAPSARTNAYEWIPVAVPDDIPLPDGKLWPEVGTAFPWHPLGKPAACHWFHNEAGQVVSAECRFEFDRPPDANDAADANAAQADAGAPVPNTLIHLTADAADAADSKLPSFSGASEKKQKTYRPLVYARRRDNDQVRAWRWQRPPRPYPLFNLPRLLAERDRPVLITEGARKAAAAGGLFPDFVPTAMLFGAEAPSKSDCSPLAGRDIVIWPDHDAAGLNFAREVWAILSKVGAVSVRVIAVPAPFPPKWDLGDPLPDGVTVDDLRALIEAAEPLTLASDPTDEGPSNAEPSEELLADLVERAKEDVGAPFEPASLHILADHKMNDRAAFMRLRAKLKTETKVLLGELDEALAAAKPEADDPNQATMMVQLAIDAGAELFHNAAGDGFVTVAVDGHVETWPLRSRTMRSWLVKLYFDFSRAAPNSEALHAALNVLGAKAQFEGSELAVHLRVGDHEGRIYLDLCDRDWRAVEIGPDGWSVITNPPIRFRRTAGMLPLPQPEPRGSIEELRPFLNVGAKTGHQEDPRFILAVAWLLAALRPRGPYPILGLSGDHGAAKTSFARVLRMLVDPNFASLRSLPRQDRDLFVAANNGHVTAFDNVSGPPDWLSDSLCRLATGGGFSTRMLYTDGDEILFDAMRPIILNGIEDFVTRSDLADRTILQTLQEILEEQRRPESELWSAFEVARPRILGVLLDAVAHGLKMLPHTKLSRLPRMADFALWICACEGALWKPGTFIAVYDDNRAAAVETVLEADAVGTALLSLMSKRTTWEGTATDLLAAVNGETTDAVRREKKWPKDGRALSSRLRRATPALRRIGITVDRDREGKARTKKITISCSPGVAEKLGNFASAAFATPAPAQNARDIKSVEADAGGTQTCEADANDAGVDANDSDGDDGGGGVVDADIPWEVEL
jgi:hypothetical protein